MAAIVADCPTSCRGGEQLERQWLDVQGVLNLQAGLLDADYLRKWAADLELLDLLERAMQESECR
jgi:hypothetical protein